MNDFFTQLQKMARTIRLSHDEKQVMRVQLYTYFEQNAIRSAASSSAPQRSVPSPYFLFSPRFSMPFAALLLMIITGGTAFAAKGSLPGDKLYSVKINVNERVATALATSPEAKAQVNAALATTRLEEAESLASSGKLDGATSAALASNFSMHVSEAQNNTKHLESKDPGAAAQLGAQFDSTLSAHGAILAQLGDDSTSSETTENSNSLATRVREVQRGSDEVFAIATDDSVRNQHEGDDVQANAKVSGGSTRARTMTATAPQAPQATTMSLSAASTGVATSGASTTAPAPMVKAMTKTSKTKASTTEGSNAHNPKDAQIAASLAAQASTSLTTTIKDFAALTTLDSNTSALIKTQIATMQGMYASASASLAAGDISTAKDGFSKVLRMSVKLGAYLKAGKKFNVSLLSSLLGVVPSPESSGKGNTDKTITTTTKQTSGKVKGVATTTASTSHDASVETSTTSSSNETESDGKRESEEKSSGGGSLKDAIKQRLHL